MAPWPQRAVGQSGGIRQNDSSLTLAREFRELERGGSGKAHVGSWLLQLGRLQRKENAGTFRVLMALSVVNGSCVAGVINEPDSGRMKISGWPNRVTENIKGSRRRIESVRGLDDA